jgi:hypothetical protein
MHEPAPDHSPEFRRWPAALFCVALLALTLAPLAREQDSFPLSSYPMFSSVRTKPWISIVVGRDAQGEQRPIPPRLVANAEVMQAAQTIGNAVRRKQAGQLCERVAERIAGEPAWADVVSVEVQSRQFDPFTYFTSDEGRTPLRVRRRARCEVPR